MKKLVIVVLVCVVCSLSQGAPVYTTGFSLDDAGFGIPRSGGNFGNPGPYIYSQGTDTGESAAADTGYTILATDQAFQMTWDVKQMDQPFLGSEVTGTFGYDAGAGYVSLGSFDATGAAQWGNASWISSDILGQAVASAAGAVGQTLLVQFDYTHVTTATDHRAGLDNVAVSVVPEPMTMCLLGLGGLFLRRKK
ncbi:hypothetical protein LCGC14_2538380 [marine sediment metagenome]|uniref:Ice-binding protein C-terminal domain-containing protein n=1 Tax=marine sediment metagenome TaxID=412755 RepID=A0A0F9D300_9ZZZZ